MILCGLWGAPVKFLRVCSVHDFYLGDVRVVMKRLFFACFALALFVSMLVAVGSAAVTPSDWSLIGPDGGNVRSLAYDPSDPSRLMLGTSAGQLFVSPDGGKSWSPLAHLGVADDLVIDHIVFDPDQSENHLCGRLGSLSR